MDIRDVKALTFDVYGTVADWRSAVIAEGRALGAAKGLSVDWEAFVDDWKTCYRPGMDRVRTGAAPWTNVDEMYRAKLEAMLPEYGITGLSDAEKADLTNAWYRSTPWPDSVPGLKRLKSRYLLSTLSNANFVWLVRMAKHAGLPWDCVLASENARTYKPDPKVYRMAIGLLGLDPGQIMMVAAHNYDLASAAQHGMRTAFVPRPREYGPNQKSDLRPEGSWDLVAGSMEDLATRLGT